jgi:hypothetical protein
VNCGEPGPQGTPIKNGSMFCCIAWRNGRFIMIRNKQCSIALNQLKVDVNCVLVMPNALKAFLIMNSGTGSMWAWNTIGRVKSFFDHIS